MEAGRIILRVTTGPFARPALGCYRDGTPWGPVLILPGRCRQITWKSSVARRIRFDSLLGFASLDVA